MLVADRLDSLINTTEAANILGVSHSTVVKWRKTGKLEVRGLDERNRPLYRLGELAQVELATGLASGRR